MAQRSAEETVRLEIYVPATEAGVVRQVAKGRGLSVSRWLREAIQWNLVREGRRHAPAAEEAYIRTVFQDVFAGVNFAAIAAQAVLLLLKQQEQDRLIHEGQLPAPLAQQKMDLLAEEALLHAAEIFANPMIQQEYSWHQRTPDAVPGIFRQAVAGDGEEAAPCPGSP